ncbi:hypothetical protein CDAR_33211 [Caerostris darwini]|uniref:Uncharacterized protein n=1 Tax=Caerostris darwini TaxID=1538125 RepID=A0AAV4X582_9ARAC|nr:hypothetical protein CDAR_33211 [Caerostris darwini]
MALLLHTCSVYSSVNIDLVITSAKEKSLENWPPTFAFMSRCLPTRITHRRIMNSGAFAPPSKSCSPHTAHERQESWMKILTPTLQVDAFLSALDSCEWIRQKRLLMPHSKYSHISFLKQDGS